MQWNILNRIFKHGGTKNILSYHLVCVRKHTYKVHLKEFLNLFKCLASRGIYTVSECLGLLFKAFHQERERERENKLENSHKAYMGTLKCGYSPLIYRHLVCRFFIKALIIMSIFTNIHRPYVCDPLRPNNTLLLKLD